MPRPPNFFAAALRNVWILAAAVVFASLALSQTRADDASALVHAEFTATTAEIPNPERGFYVFGGPLDQLGAAAVATDYNSGHRLIYTLINLQPYRTSRIPRSYLRNLTTGFANARRGGIKLIVRAVYNYPSEAEAPQARDATLARVQAHLRQLKPIFQNNADVIAFVQAGFVGRWGEWHDSDAITDPSALRAVRDAVLNAVPANRFVQFRYPRDIMAWTPTLPPLQAALSGQFRIGFHNDCFLASADDVGTYRSDAERAYTDALGELSPFGGETCASGADDQRTSCDAILSEGARYNLTYLNDSYYRRAFHENWIAQGCMPEVERSMGYRFAFVRADHASYAARGGVFSVSIVVRNSGWARLYNPRPVEVMFRDPVTGAARRVRATGGDPRRWLPGQKVDATLAVRIPADLRRGSQEVWLALPDMDSRISGDPRFSIRPANADDVAKAQTWDPALGAFALGARVDIR
ncbi:MAG: DUF4832 domain-containing protein [Alphaproteobacteria bacterium]